jgi:serine/threonine protein kinase
MTESTSRTASNDSRNWASVREGQIVAGKYVVGRTLGVGGMGIVYAARDARLDRQVAIKVLLPGLVTSETATQRFMREARAATRITSEHVVKLLEMDTLPDGTPVLVMEYLEGRDLRAVLRADGPLPPRLAIDYLLQALQAVAEGHMQTIVHRDLKPSNLFLTTRADGTPLIKVLDFGIAKTLEPDSSDTFALTRSEDVRLGSPTYMPPEQLLSPRDVDMRSDIWALGVTLHELVNGSPPFQGHTYAELLSRILAAPPESLRSGIPELPLPEGLSAIVAKCLEKKRESRYSNAVELATALAPFGSDDARLSLHRVTGLSRSPSTPRGAVSSGPATIVSDLIFTCDTTMPVPADFAAAQVELPPSGSRRVVARRAWPRRLAFGAVGAAVTLALGAFAWRGQHGPQPRASAAVSPLLASSVSATRTALPALPRASAPALTRSAMESAPPGPAASPLPPAAASSPPRHFAASKATASKTEPTSPAAASVPEPASKASLGASATPGTGKPADWGLPQIKRLIENRH